MSIFSAFNAAIALIEGREEEALEMLKPFVGTEISNYSDIQHLQARLEEAVKDRTVKDSHNLLQTLLRDELMQPVTGSKDMTTHDMVMYCRGRNDAIRPFETAWQDLKTQLKPPTEYEPVSDDPKGPVDRIFSRN